MRHLPEVPSGSYPSSLYYYTASCWTLLDKSSDSWLVGSDRVGLIYGLLSGVSLTVIVTVNLVCRKVKSKWQVQHKAFLDRYVPARYPNVIPSAI